MLEMTKTVLQKVSFDRKLFKKELMKATRWLKKDELLQLQAWCIVMFGAKYGDLIAEVFQSIS
ncbi:MAG: hypothetical protein COA57_05565 [Flavobacteriales bacterium]|nr:MAG: hypothetical protein COA57_05565 [Flavobacteriales bacterium]